MISGRRRAPGRLGLLYDKPRGVQFGIGHYESVGAEVAIEQALAQPIGPQVVSAPQSGDASALGARHQLSSGVVLGVLLAAAWAGYAATKELRRA